MSTVNDWFEDSYEDDVEAREAKLEQTIAFERTEAVAAERLRVDREGKERREAAALRRTEQVGAPDAIRLQAEAKLKPLYDELALIDTAFATTPLPELRRERALVVAEIRGRESALPFVNRSDDELEAAVEPSEIAIEEARERLEQLPEGSTRRAVAKREYDRLLVEKDALAVERRQRAERASVAQARERQITKYALDEFRKQYSDKISALAMEQRSSSGLQLRELDLEIEHLRIEAAKDPTPEQLAKFLPKVTEDYDKRILDHARRSAAVDVINM